MNDGNDKGKIEKRLSRIRHKVLVLSGKGGVGKSTVAVNLAVALAAAGRKTGLLDVDIHGPSVPKMLGIEKMMVHGTADSISPLEVGDNLRVMSIGLLLRDTDDAVIWRGPLKMSVIKQFLGDVEWGDLDYLIIDSPPGTGDEPLSIAQLIPDADGAVIVTTPQSVALIDVRKCVTFCRQLNLPVIGVVENMSGFVCPHCGERTELFKSGGGEKMAAEMGIPFLGAVPFEPAVVETADLGEPFVIKHAGTETGKIFSALAASLMTLKGRASAAAKEAAANAAGASAPEAKRTDGETTAADSTSVGKSGEAEPATGGKEEARSSAGVVKVALPVDGGLVSAHFGHAARFVFFEVDSSSNEIRSSREAVPPPHEEGVIPEWLHREGVTVVITGGLGRKARQIFEDNGIEVITGAPAADPAEVVRLHFEGALDAGENACGHGPEGGHGGGAHGGRHGH